MASLQALLFLLFFAISDTVSGQTGTVDKFEARSAAIFNWDGRGWQLAHTTEDLDILVVINLNSDKVNVYAKQETEIDIISWDEPFTDEDGDRVMRFRGVDQKGREVRGSIIRIESARDGLWNLFLTYDNVRVRYTMVHK